MTERASDERLAEMLVALCGDECNGGLIRAMAYTVWHNCHHPKHEDGNSDWINDNLPLANEVNERVRENLRSIITELQELRKAVADAHRIIEACLAVAQKGDPHDAPIPLAGSEAVLWHRARAEAFRHALEMMPTTGDKP